MSFFKHLSLRPARRPILLLAVAWLSAVGCQTQTSPTVPSPSPSPSPVGSETPAGSTAPSPSAMHFRDDFEGTVLDPSRWLVAPQSGVVALADGKVELANSSGNRDFPYVLAKPELLPPSGPFFLEVAYATVVSGPVSFCLDYLPMMDPAERPLSTPFMYTEFTKQDLLLRFSAEQKDVVITAVGGSETKIPHVLRVECDGNGQFRVIVDGNEVGLFKSDRRPTKFWMGYPKNAPVPAVWGRVQVDYIEAGTLTAPASAKPFPSPTAEASASPSPQASSSVAP